MGTKWRSSDVPKRWPEMRIFINDIRYSIYLNFATLSEQQSCITCDTNPRHREANLWLAKQVLLYVVYKHF